MENMKNMDTRLTVPKWVLIHWPKIPQMHQKLSAQMVSPNLSVWNKWVPHGVEGEHWLCNPRISGWMFDPWHPQLEKVVYLDENSWTRTKTNSNGVIEFFMTNALPFTYDRYVYR